MARAVGRLVGVLLLVGLGALGGCLESRVESCGDRFCFGATTCIASTHCATADQQQACSGLVDGDSCSLAGSTGYCDLGVCIASGCGNAVVDPGEACDDGNLTSGDGCPADCRKIEVCGDAVADAGEDCDDGNANPADGCDACVETAWAATALIGGTMDATLIEMAPIGIAIDRFGNRYVADRDHSVIRRIDATGIATTVAGTGTPGFSGDGGQATGAQLQFPMGIAVDGSGQLYIADSQNHRIRRVDTQGVITTIAGNGVEAYGGDDGPAAAALLGRPESVTIDGLGNLLVADTGNHCVRRIDLNGIISRVAGVCTSNGFSGDGAAATTAQLAAPRGMAVTSAALFIADSGNQRVRRVDALGTITTYAGTTFGGYNADNILATDAALLTPTDVVVDAAGRVIVADSGNARVRRIDPNTKIITTIAGTGSQGGAGDGGPAIAAQLYAPTGVAIAPDGSLHVSDELGYSVRAIDGAGVIHRVAGNGMFGGAGDGDVGLVAPLASPGGLALDPAGNLYIADRFNHRVRRLAPDGVLGSFAGSGTTVTGGFGGDGGPASAARLFEPSDVALDAAGNVYICDQNNNRIRRVDSTGTITTYAGSGSQGAAGDGGPATSAQLVIPSGIGLDAAGNLYIADWGNHRVRRVDATTKVITTVAGAGTPGFSGDNGAATSAQLDSPADVVIDAAGNLYIADAGNRRIRKVTAGTITTYAGIGTSGGTGDGGAATAAQLGSPRSLALDAGGNLLIADNTVFRLRRISAAGVITTVAGSAGGQNFLGDGGAPTLARLRAATGVAVDPAGVIYIGETGSDAIRKVAAGKIVTVAGAIDPGGTTLLPRARLADPRAIALGTSISLYAGGSSGRVQAIRSTGDRVEVVAGRYPQSAATADLARYRSATFGEAGGLAIDAAAGVFYVSETSNNRIHAVSMVDPVNADTWTIATLANTAGTAGHLDGPAGAAQFREPAGLYLDVAAKHLYVADRGNHVVRDIDLVAGTVTTVAGVPATRGFFGDGAAATSALLYQPSAITKCGNDLFVADTGNHRVRRIAAGSISTVVGVGVGVSAGEGAPASSYPVDEPRGLACDATGNLYVTSSATVRMVSVNDQGVVDGSGKVQTIYGTLPRNTYPASVTSCLTGLAIVDATKLQVVDSCTGLIVQLERKPVTP